MRLTEVFNSLEGDRYAKPKTTPTIKEAKIERKIEVHFFDFQSDIYEAYLALCLHERMRSEQKFENLEALKSQLKKDELAARAYFQKI